MKRKLTKLLSIVLAGTMLLSSSMVFATEAGDTSVGTIESQEWDNSENQTDSTVDQTTLPGTEEPTEETMGQPEATTPEEETPADTTTGESVTTPSEEEATTGTEDTAPETEPESSADDVTNGVKGETSTAASAPVPQAPSTMRAVLQEGDATVAASKFTIYKDDAASGAPASDVTAGDLSETAPDLIAENLYFDHAEVNGKRVYEVGTLNDITYYSSISGALSILGDGETINLYYVSKYPVTYHVSEAVVTAKDDLVQKGNSLTFRVKPSGRGKRLVVSANGNDITSTGTVFDDSTGEMLFTVENVQAAQTISIQEDVATTYTLTYNQEDGAFRNGGITSPESGMSITPGGTIEIQMQSSGTLTNRYVLNMLVINGHEVTTLPSDAGEGAYVESTLPSGETVRVTLTHEDYTDPWPPYDYTNHYTVTISNVYSDLYISEANFKLDDRNEIILKELSGIENIVGWDYAAESYVEGSVNHVYQQTRESGSEFYFSVQSGYENPQLVVKVNGVVSDANVHFEENSGPLYDGRDPSFTQEEYRYRFDLPNDLGDNVELFLTATPINYSVAYQNDKNNNDLIGEIESGFTVEPGNKDTITITSRTPYETVAGYSPDGYVLKGDTSGTVYRAGDTVSVKDAAAYAQGNTIIFTPNWVPTEEVNERQITINLFIENPTTGRYIKADSYLLSVGEGRALFRPNDERGREHILEYLTSSGAPSWASTYNTSDFVLKEGEQVQIVEADQESLDFHYDVKKGTLTVKFEWGTGETGTGSLPESITEEFAIKQAFSKDISASIPQGYMASASTVTGTMIEGGVEKTVYLYKDADGNNKPDAYTITLTFNAKDDGTIYNDGNLTPGGVLSPDNKTLTYKLVKAGAEGIQPDTYPGYIPRITETTVGMGWLGWQKENTTGDDNRYAAYAGETVDANATDITFEAIYDILDGYETVTINYHREQESGEFTLHDSLERLAKPGDAVSYPRTHVDGYVTPNEGTNGSVVVTEDGANTVDVYYYLDKDNNSKPDVFTVTLSFTGTGHGSWDIKDTMWERLVAGKDYIYDTGSATLQVFLIKENTAGFAAGNYPEAPKVDPKETYLFDSWQDGNKKAYGSGVDGDGITVGSSVGANDTDKSYTSVYDRDLNSDGTPDDEQSVTVTFKAGEHGNINGKTEFVVGNLVPQYSSYPNAPAVTADKDYVFDGWEPAYTEGGNPIEANATRTQTYTAVYKDDKNNDGIADDKQSVTVTFEVQENGTIEGQSTYMDLLPTTSTYPVAPTVKADEGYVFVGWEPDYTKKAGTPVETDALRNQTYTAVIKEDKNNNGQPDDEETTYTLTYDGNAQSGGQVGNLPTDSNTYLTKEKVTLDSKTIPSHTEVNDTAVLFIGWSATKTTQIYSKEDAAEFEKIALLTEVTFTDSNETVYAVWGYDSDGDNTPDVQDTYYTVTTVLNGEGTGHSITPENPLVKAGESQTFTISAAKGYAVKTIAVDNGVVYTNDGKSEQLEGGKWTLEKVEKACTVTVTFGTDANGNGIPDDFEEPENPNLIEIVAPDAITGVPNGTPIDKIGLPSKVTIKTTDGDKEADVVWNTSAAKYDPNSEKAQNFTLEGTVTLPAGVENTNQIPLTTSISISVNAKGEEPVAAEYTLTVNNGTGDGKYAAKSEVTIKADAAPEGKVFDKWVTSNGGTFADAASATTTFTMPGNDVTVTATYKDAPTTPNEPSDPDDTESSKPNDPTDPDDTNTSDSDKTDSSAEDMPKTGDSTQPALWLLVMGLSCAGLIATIVKIKKRALR